MSRAELHCRATFLTEVEFIAADAPTRWMDEARHTDVFRKRALANGGGLGAARRLAS